MDVLPHITRNCLWYNCEIGYISKANHVRFDKGMNDLPSNLISSNQPYLECVEQGDKSPADPDKIVVDKEFKFFVYPFSKIEKECLHVHSNYKSPTFGLVLEVDPQYGQAYVLDINKRSSAAHVSSSLKATPKAIRLSYIVELLVVVHF